MSITKRVKRHFSFDKREKKEFTITTIIFTLIIFLYAWRVTDINFAQGVVLLFGLAIISAISLYIYIATAKSYAISRGYTATYNYWMTGQLTGFLIAFLSYGIIPVLFPGYITISTIDRLRHGKIFPGENKSDIFAVLSVTTLIPIITSVIFLLLYKISGANIFQFGAILNAFIVFFSLIPFVNNNGSHLFYTNRKKYAFLIIFAIVYLALLLTTSLFMLIGVLIFTGVIWYLFVQFIKSKFW